MTTTISLEGVEVRDAQAERVQLRLLMSWIDTAPAELGLKPEHFATVASHIFARDIDPGDLTDLHDALTAEAKFEPERIDAVSQMDYAITKYIEARVEIATDTLLDVRRCQACLEVIEDDTTTSDCTNGDTYCCWQEHQAAHLGSHCDGLS